MKKKQFCEMTDEEIHERQRAKDEKLARKVMKNRLKSRERNRRIREAKKEAKK